MRLSHQKASTDISRLEHTHTHIHYHTYTIWHTHKTHKIWLQKYCWKWNDGTQTLMPWKAASAINDSCRLTSRWFDSTSWLMRRVWISSTVSYPLHPRAIRSFQHRSGKRWRLPGNIDYSFHPQSIMHTSRVHWGNWTKTGSAVNQRYSASN